jgi:plasmid maintenance system killer protein
VIQSFAERVTEKIFLGEDLSRKELKKLGNLDIPKTQQRLAILNQASEQDLLRLPMLHYHRLQGNSRYSIDATSRKSPWRITFAWTDEQAIDVELVMLEDTH